MGERIPRIAWPEIFSVKALRTRNCYSLKTRTGNTLIPNLVHIGHEYHDGVVVVDIDGDGDLDIVWIGCGQGKVHRYESRAISK